MDQDQLVTVMLEEAKDLSKSKKMPTEDEPIEKYLKRKKNKVASEQIFFQAILSALWANGNGEDAKKQWLPDWVKKSFRDNAKHILPLPLLIFLMSLLSFSAKAQTEVTIGGGVSTLKDGFVSVAIAYAQSRDSVWQRKNNFIAGKNSFTSFYPKFSFRAGSADLPNIADFKLEGLTIAFKNKRIATVTRGGVREDLIAPDLSKTFHTFPFSVGLEMSGPGIEKLTQFNTINGIVELGWVPWFQQVDALDNVTFGLFAQGGYKFHSVRDSAVGAEVDESLEKPKNGIFRLKGTLGGSVDTVIKNSGFRFGVEGEANAWWDIVNSAAYYQAIGNLKFYISGNTTLLVGFNYGNGSPLFNDAWQGFVGLRTRW